jgi:hypothetical protein
MNDQPDTLTTVKTYGSEIEALMDQAKLDASGIPSYIFKDDLGGMRPHLQTSLGVELKVNNVSVDEAVELLSADDDQEIQYDPVENKIALISLAGVVICAAGIAITIIGFQGGINKLLTGLGITLIGVALEVYSKILKKRSK